MLAPLSWRPSDPANAVLAGHPSSSEFVLSLRSQSGRRNVGSSNRSCSQETGNDRKERERRRRPSWFIEKILIQNFTKYNQNMKQRCFSCLR